MKVTRDVVYDLLPAYFADEVSTDTRELLEEFLATDPDFARMAERFRGLLQEQHDLSPEIDANRERASFDRVRARVKLRQAAIVWAAAALVAFGIAMVTASNLRFGLSHPGIVIAVVCGAIALAAWLASNRFSVELWYDVVSGGVPHSHRRRRRAKRESF